MASGEPRSLPRVVPTSCRSRPKRGGEATARLAAPSEIADVSFPVSVRGYDRGAVDAFVSRVQLLVAELEVTRSPEAAVKQALGQVAEQTKGILEQAGATAEQITVAARQEAEDSSVRAKQEAESVVGAAKTEAEEMLSARGPMQKPRWHKPGRRRRSTLNVCAQKLLPCARRQRHVCASSRPTRKRSGGAQRPSR